LAIDNIIITDIYDVAGRETKKINEVKKIIDPRYSLLMDCNNFVNMMFDISKSKSSEMKDNNEWITHLNLIKKQLPLDFIFIQEAITDDFNVFKDNFEFIINFNLLNSDLDSAIEK
jgi:hypothetical protein